MWRRSSMPCFGRHALRPGHRVAGRRGRAIGGQGISGTAAALRGADARVAARNGAEGGVRLLGSAHGVRAAGGAAAVSSGDLQGTAEVARIVAAGLQACPFESVDDHQPVDPGGASRRCGGRLGSQDPGSASPPRPPVGDLRADDRRGHARRGAAVLTRRVARRGRHDLPLRAALADDGGVRRARARACAPVSQRHAGAVFCRLQPRRVSHRGPRAAGSREPRRPHGPGAGGVGLQPA